MTPNDLADQKSVTLHKILRIEMANDAVYLLPCVTYEPPEYTYDDNRGAVSPISGYSGQPICKTETSH